MLRSAPASATAALILAFAVAACHHKPELTPVQVAQNDMTEYQTEIRKVVKDSTRADQLVALSNEAQKIVDEVTAADKATVERFAALDSNYTSTRPQYETALQQTRADRRTAANKLIALRVQMGALTTDDEWEQLKKVRMKMFDAEMSALEI